MPLGLACACEGERACDPIRMDHSRCPGTSWPWGGGGTHLWPGMPTE